MKSLKLVAQDQLTREEVAMAEITQAQRDYRTETNAPWQPFTEPRKNPLLPVDEIQARSFKWIAVDSRPSLLQRILRKIKRQA